jgi:hypothetical protein
MAFRDVGHRPILEMKRPEQARLIHRQADERARDRLLRLRRLGHRRGVGRPGHVAAGDGLERKRPPPAVVARQQVVRDRDQPGQRFIGRPAAPPLAHGPQPRFLGHVLGKGAVAAAVARRVGVERVYGFAIDGDDAVLGGVRVHASLRI